MPTPTTSAERGRDVRQRLLRAAAELIAERGWTAVSTRILAERAGVRPGLVHYHFSSLPALLRESAVGAIRGALESVRPMFAPTTTPDAGLDMMLGQLEHYSGTDPASALFIEAFLAAARDEELRAGLAEILDEFRRDLAGWLAGQGVADPEETAAVLAAAVDGVMLHRALNPDMTAAAVAPVLRRLLRPQSDQEAT